VGERSGGEGKKPHDVRVEGPYSARGVGESGPQAEEEETRLVARHRRVEGGATDDRSCAGDLSARPIQRKGGSGININVLRGKIRTSWFDSGGDGEKLLNGNQFARGIKETTDHSRLFSQGEKGGTARYPPKAAARKKGPGPNGEKLC